MEMCKKILDSNIDDGSEENFLKSFKREAFHLERCFQIDKDLFKIETKKSLHINYSFENVSLPKRLTN